MNATGLSDTGWRFPPHFSTGGKHVLLASGENEIRESLTILLSTLVGERLYHPDFGCDLKKFMFEEVDNSLVTEIQEMIAAAIYTYEPRVEVLEITVTEEEKNGTTLVINISYFIHATNREESMVYTLPLY